MKSDPGARSIGSSVVFGADVPVRPFAFERAAAAGLYISKSKYKGEFGNLVSEFKYHGKHGPDLAEVLDKALKHGGAPEADELRAKEKGNRTK